MNLVEISVFETGIDSVNSSSCDMAFSCFNGRFLRLFSFGRSLLLVTLVRELSPSIPFAALNLLFFILPDLSDRVLLPRSVVVFLFVFPALAMQNNIIHYKIKK